MAIDYYNADGGVRLLKAKRDGSNVTQVTTLGSVNLGTYTSEVWLRVTLRAQGNSLQAEVYRGDTNQYLSSNGAWQSAPGNCLTATDSTLSASGLAGIEKAGEGSGPAAVDAFNVTPIDPTTQTFDSTTVGQLPSGWESLASSAVVADQWKVSNLRSSSGTQSLAVQTAAGGTESRAWLSAAQPADVSMSALFYVNSSIPGEVLVRGQGLNTPNPEYYALAVDQNTPDATNLNGVRLYKRQRVNGISNITHLGTAIKLGPDYFSDQWVRLTLRANGNQLSAEVFWPAQGKYLNSLGQWQTTAAICLTTLDNGLSSSGQVGVSKPGEGAGPITFDDVKVQPIVPNLENFDTTTVGQAPAGWSNYTTTGTSSDFFKVQAATGLGGSNSLVGQTAGGSNVSRSWLTTTSAADVTVSAMLKVQNAIPGMIFARGNALDTTSATFYAISADTQGVKLWKKLSGMAQPEQIGVPLAFSPYTETWVKLTLRITGTTLTAELYRPDNNQYLSTAGVWQATPGVCRTETVTELTGAGYTGVMKPNDGAGPIVFDDFSSTGVAALPPPAPTGIELNQASFANGPYLLDQNDKTYYLADNVTVPGTAFVVKANNVTLDLNGKTVTYGNTPHPVVANHSFEAALVSGAIPNWKLAKVGTSGAHGLTVSLLDEQAGMWDNKMLRLVS